MADGTVKIKVEADKEKAEKQLSTMGKLGKGAMGILGKATKVATAAVAAIGVAAVKTGAQFESTMSNVAAISGATSEEMQQLTEYAKQMGRTSAFSASEAGQAMTYMAMAGWKAEDMMHGLKGVMDLAAASGEDLASVSDIVTDALTAFGKSASDSTHFADVMAAASSNANTNVAMLGESFKYVGAVAGAVGYSIEDVAVALGLMANAGVKGSQAGTSLRAAITRLAKPTKQMDAYLEKLGVSLSDQSGNVKPLNVLLAELREKFAGLSEAEKTEAATAIFGKEAMAGMLAVINASDEDFTKLTDAINNSSGAAATMAQIKLDNLAGQFTLLKSAAEGFLLELYGSDLAAPLTNMVKTATKYVGQLTSAFKNGGFSSLATVAGYQIQGIARSFEKAAPGILKAVSDLVLKAMSGLTKAAPAITSKIGELLKKVISGIRKNGPKFISAAADLISSFAEGIGQQLPTLVPQALNAVLTLVQALTNNIPKLVQAGIKLIKGLVQGIVNALPTLIAQAPVVINNFADAIYSGIGSLLKAGFDMIKSLAAGIKQNWPLIKQHALDILMAIINVFSLAKLLALGKSLIVNMGKGVKSAGPKLVDGLKNAGKKAFEAIKKIDWKGAGRTLLTSIINGVKAVMSGLPSALKGAGTKAIRAVKAIDWKGAGRAAINAIISGVKAVMSGLASALKGAGQKALRAAKNIDWKGLGTNIVHGIKNGITGAAGAIASAAKNAARSALDAAKKALGIHSPSRIFRDEVGKMMIRGAEVGIDVEAPKLANVTADAFDAVTASLSAAAPLSISTTVSHQVARSEQRQEDNDSLRGAVKSGIAEALDGAIVDIDGRRAGHLLVPFIDKELGRRVPV